MDNVYICKEVAELASDAHKVGKAIDKKKREAQLNTGSAQGSQIIYTRPTHNAKIIEDIVKVAQRRYHIASLGGQEHYNNNVEHSVDIIDVAATVVDTLTSSFEYIQRDALFNKVIKNLESIRGDGYIFKEEKEEEDDTLIYIETILPEDTLVDIGSTIPKATEDKLAQFIADVCIVDQDRNVHTSTLLEAYNNWNAEDDIDAKYTSIKEFVKMMRLKGFDKEVTKINGVPPTHLLE